MKSYERSENSGMRPMICAFHEINLGVTYSNIGRDEESQ